MKSGRNLRRRLATAVLMLAGVLFASIAWGGKTSGKAQPQERGVVTDKGGDTWKAEVKAEVGTQLLELVEEAAKLRQDNIAEANPVLVAYDKLSSQMQGWFTLFAVIGAIFGILVPSVTYWLQIKTAERQEDRIEKLIQDAVKKEKTDFGQLIDLKVTAAEREMDGTMQKKIKELDAKMANLWNYQSIFIMKSIEELKQKLMHAWEAGQDGATIGFALLLFFGLLEECVYATGKNNELKETASQILRTFKGLRSSASARGQWKDFVSKLAARSKGTLFEFHFNEDLLGKETYREWTTLCAELGIRVAEEMANEGNQKKG